MRLLLPLGLLALVGILVLILIYIIKPNFQQKLISSTYIWKLSLKYRKRKIPISKLRNILLVACQVLIISAIAMILSKTVLVLKEQVSEPEVVLIIDSSASMRTEDGGKTRYERAVDAAIQEAEKVFDRGGIVSVLLAADDNVYLAERAQQNSRDQLVAEMRGLLDEGMQCSYASADMSAAVAMTDRILIENPTARIHLFSDKTYADLTENITLVNVAQEDEWNAAILNATATYEDNYYTFRVEVAVYGRDKDLTVNLTINGINAESSEDKVAGDLTLTESVSCMGDGVYTIVFKYVPEEEEDAYLNTLDDHTVFHNIDKADRAYAYQSVVVSIDEADSLPADNAFSIYGGLKETIKIQYYSTGADPYTGESLGPNVFFQEALAALQKIYADRWDIQVTEVKKGNPAAMEGFDFYIFEHTMPEVLPTDGVVLLADPMTAPTDAGFKIERLVDFSKKSVYLAPDVSHPIMSGMTPTEITVSRYEKVTYDPCYTPLMSYAQDPMLLVRNDAEARVAVMCFSLHYSNIAMQIDFPLMMYNMFGYYFPTTVSSNAFEASETVSINCRGESLTLSNGKQTITFDTFPAKAQLDTPGAYTIRQTTYAGKTVDETIFVRIPRAESDIFLAGEALKSPDYEINESDYFDDLLLYIACALVALLMLEWYLQHRESNI